MFIMLRSHSSLISILICFLKIFQKDRVREKKKKFSKMDPDSVKSTLSNLAFGNVMAAAARDYQKVCVCVLLFNSLCNFFFFLIFFFFRSKFVLLLLYLYLYFVGVFFFFLTNVFQQARNL